LARPHTAECVDTRAAEGCLECGAGWRQLADQRPTLRLKPATDCTAGHCAFSKDGVTCFLSHDTVGASPAGTFCIFCGIGVGPAAM
jgi:hypothetical protein